MQGIENTTYADIGSKINPRFYQACFQLLSPAHLWLQLGL